MKCQMKNSVPKNGSNAPSNGGEEDCFWVWKPFQNIQNNLASIYFIMRKGMHSTRLLGWETLNVKLQRVLYFLRFSNNILILRFIFFNYCLQKNKLSQTACFYFSTSFITFYKIHYKELHSLSFTSLHLRKIEICLFDTGI